MNGKPLLCRLGFHQWYLDSAIFCSVRRCYRCSVVDNESAAEKVALERKIWKEESQSNSDFVTVAFAVSKKLQSRST